MDNFLTTLKPIFARLKQCDNDEQALAVIVEYVEQGTLSLNEGFSLAILYIEEQRKKAKLKQPKQARQNGFVMNF